MKNKNNSSNQNNKNKTSKQKFVSKTFKQVINGTKIEIDDLVPVIISQYRDLFGVTDILDSHVTSLDAMAWDMFTKFSDKIPQMRAGGLNSYWALTFASNRIALKTEDGYQFGWIIKYNKRRTNYESVEFFYTAYAAKALPENEDYINAGWVLSE